VQPGRTITQFGEETFDMKKTIKAKVNQVQTQRRLLDIGELDQVYGGKLVQDPGTKG
jgi:hypothetical protein